MEELSQYLKILYNRFDNPPRDAPQILMRDLRRYDYELIFEYEDGEVVAGLTLLLFGPIHLIHFMASIESGKGYGTRLLKKVFCKHRGVFIAKTHTASEFYLKKGFKRMGERYFYFNGRFK